LRGARLAFRGAGAGGVQGFEWDCRRSHGSHLRYYLSNKDEIVRFMWMWITFRIN
jgi:hypothetical protein